MTWSKPGPGRTRTTAPSVGRGIRLSPGDLQSLRVLAVDRETTVNGLIREYIRRGITVDLREGTRAETVQRIIKMTESLL